MAAQLTDPAHSSSKREDKPVNDLPLEQLGHTRVHTHAHAAHTYRSAVGSGRSTKQLSGCGVKALVFRG